MKHMVLGITVMVIGLVLSLFVPLGIVYGYNTYVQDGLGEYKALGDIFLFVGLAGWVVTTLILTYGLVAQSVLKKD